MYLKVAGPISLKVWSEEGYEDFGLKSEWFLFEAKRIKWQRLKYPLETVQKLNVDRKILSKHNCGSEGACSGCSPLDTKIDFFEAYLWNEAGNEYIVIFDTQGFIVNDDGKTIERLAIH